MNPNACEFIPFKMDFAEPRKYERQHLVEQITSTKTHLGEQNTSLILLHTELNTDYAVLSYQMSRRENKEFPCYSKEQIDLLHSKYTQQSQYYYKQYSKFNDLTSELLALQQKLHRLLLSPSLNTNTPPNHTIISIHPSFTIPDGLSPENNHHSPSSTPCNVLPPILESDAESSPWNEPFDHDHDAQSVNSAVTAPATSSAIKHPPTPIQKPVESAESKEKQLELAKTSDIDLKQSTPANAHNFEFENKINALLDTIWNRDIKAISDEFDAFIAIHCGNNKSVEVLIDCVIRHAVCIGKPVFFGSKYSSLCQSIIVSLSKRRMSVKILELIWSICYETFTKLQFGNDSDKFVNVCIIIAELFNANLLDAQHIFQSIFKDILQQNNGNNENDDICENDIEGIYEIFKRCHRSLNSEGNKKYLNQYMEILSQIKTWDRFQNGITRVPFMINQMQNTVKNSNRKY